MAKGKNPKGNKKVGKKARLLNAQIKAERTAVVNGLATEFEKELLRRLTGGAQ